MKHLLLNLLALIFVVVGSWFTHISYNQDTYDEDKYKQHVKTLKVLGPLMIGLGLLILIMTWKQNKKQQFNDSSFGFKF